jgi:hypothetical protein
LRNLPDDQRRTMRAGHRSPVEQGKLDVQ